MVVNGGYGHLDCHRLVSAANSSAHHHNPAPRCKQHWIHRARSVDEYVQLLAQNWESEVMVHPMGDVRTSARGIIILLPSALWIGNRSRVFCTPSLTRDVADFVADKWRCPNVTVLQPTRKTMSPHHSGGSLHGRNATWSNESMSADACRIVRHVLYKRDTLLWGRLCAAEHGWGEHGWLPP